ncbi:uncharacterized protein M6B38_102975 [Iris pallida]|uniref:Uncharacterized protein n=1 Tax=Iris pallida TaxID=29817 RepID=A0AAX6G650_IRIPA|nr:uncharacterized protein M6B38_102975 [Iris pallida]
MVARYAEPPDLSGERGGTYCKRPDLDRARVRWLHDELWTQVPMVLDLTAQCSMSADNCGETLARCAHRLGCSDLQRRRRIGDNTSSTPVGEGGVLVYVSGGWYAAAHAGRAPEAG